ncbi:MAG: ribonuclease P protein component [Lentisphaerae bacterium]|nr:ribonuclease P protein component [Lentisphaerota bacterium]
MYFNGASRFGLDKRSGIPDRRLVRRQRISDSAVFREAFDAGSRYVGKFVVMLLRTGPEADLRLGVVASKRTFRRAVDRARAKRLMREAFRLNRYRMSGATDVVLVARRRILEVSAKEVGDELLALAGEAGLFDGFSEGKT